MRVKISRGVQFFCTSLRLFVKENYLRSRRASCATTKNEKSEIHNTRSQMAQNTRVQCVKWHICDVWSYDESKDFAEQKFFWTSLRLFVKENYLRYRRVSCATTKNEKSEIHNIRSEMNQNTRMQRVEWHICDLWSYDESRDFAEQEIFLTILRLFVKENYLRSCRAPCTDTKNEKSEIHNIRARNYTNTWI